MTRVSDNIYNKTQQSLFKQKLHSRSPSSSDKKVNLAKSDAEVALMTMALTDDENQHESLEMNDTIKNDENESRN